MTGPTCPGCGATKSRIFITLPVTVGIERRRRCQGCNTSFYTIEKTNTERTPDAPRKYYERKRG